MRHSLSTGALLVATLTLPLAAGIALLFPVQTANAENLHTMNASSQAAAQAASLAHVGTQSATGLLSAAAATLPTPPVAARKPFVVKSPHGDREDPYYWLRDDERKNPEMLAYLDAENAYRAAQMAPVKGLEETLYQEIVSRVQQDDSSVPARKGAYTYYTRFASGKEYPVYARRAHGVADAPEQVLLDGNALAAGHDFFQVGSYEVGTDGQLLGWAEDTVGRRQWVLRFKDLRTGALLPDRIENAEAGFAIANDNKTVFYVDKDKQTLLGKRVMRHVLGTPVSQDVEVFVNDDETYYLGVGKSRSDRFVGIYLQSTVASEQRMLDANTPDGEFKVLVPRERDHEYQAEDLGGEYIVRTNWQAKNFRLVRVKAEDIADRTKWRDVVPNRGDAFVQDFTTFNTFLAVEERTGGLSKVRVIGWDGKRDEYVTADEPSYTMALGTNEEPDATTLRYTYTSLATPGSTYDLDTTTGQRTLRKRNPVLGGYDPANYVVEYRFAVARDGTKVPVSLVYKKGTKLDGTAPIYQAAYGSYGISSDPQFSISRLPLLDRGFVYALAHIRGGQEMGRQWYEDGKLLHKKNSFTDFIDVTRYLVGNKVGAAGKVFAMGGSAGGLLVGAVANMAPLDYRGIVAHVPFVDVVTTMLDDSIPLTTTEWDEWGNPKDKAYYDYMLSYSPYDNVEKKAYPAMLVTTGLWDSQVQYFEPAKWVAKLRYLKTDTRPLLFHINMEAGHGGKSGRFQRYRETAMEYAWVLQQLDAPDCKCQPVAAAAATK